LSIEIHDFQGDTMQKFTDFKKMLFLYKFFTTHCIFTVFIRSKFSQTENLAPSQPGQFDL